MRAVAKTCPSPRGTEWTALTCSNLHSLLDSTHASFAAHRLRPRLRLWSSARDVATSASLSKARMDTICSGKKEILPVYFWLMLDGCRPHY